MGDGDAAQQRLRLFSELTRELARSTGDYRGLLQLIARRLGETIGETCMIRLVPPGGEYFAEVEGLYHPDPELTADLRTYLREHPQRTDEGFTGQVLATGESLLIERTTPDIITTSEPYHSLVERLSTRSTMLVPLRAEGVPIGVAVMMRSDPDRPYTHDDLALLEDLASHASIAITNSKLFDATRRELERHHHTTGRLRVLSELTREFAEATGDYRRLLDVISRRVGAVLEASCMIRMVAADGQWFETECALYDPEPELEQLARDFIRRRRVRVDEGIDGRVVSTGRSILLPQLEPASLATTDDAEDNAILARLAPRSLIAVPLRSAGRVVGAAVMARRVGGRPFTEDDKTLLEDLASHASIAITNSRLLDAANRELAERKRAEHELEKTEEQLRQAQKMEAIGRLAGGVAHDFNNLLSVILSYASLIIEDLPSEDPIAADVEQIREAGQRAADLTGQLLAFSRLQVVQPRILDVNALLAKIDKMNRRIVGEDIEYRTLGDPALGMVKADPSHLEQVLMNLVVNARDAMPRGGRLTIETRNVELDDRYVRDHPGAVAGPHVMIAVSDTGVGMTKETRSRIFEPFFTTKELGKGTGLGLSTVFGIIKQSGGSIYVYSEPGHGTTFKIYLPRSAEAATPLAPRPTISTLKGTETILLVEDEEQLRVIARQILVRNGYQVLDACQGDEALELARSHPGRIDLLLTDVVMPNMSGRELADELLRSRPELRVLFMSGYTDDAITYHRALDPGVQLLQKPVTPSELLHRVRTILDQPLE